jgi:hypothetical protein
VLEPVLGSGDLLSEISKMQAYHRIAVIAYADRSALSGQRSTVKRLRALARAKTSLTLDGGDVRRQLSAAADVSRFEHRLDQGRGL